MVRQDSKQSSKQVVNIKIGDSKKKRRSSKRKVTITSRPLASGPSLGSAYGSYLGPYIPVSQTGNPPPNANNAPVRIQAIGPAPSPDKPRITSIAPEAPQSTQLARDIEMDTTTPVKEEKIRKPIFSKSDDREIDYFPRPSSSPYEAPPYEAQQIRADLFVVNGPSPFINNEISRRNASKGLESIPINQSLRGGGERPSSFNDLVATPVRYELPQAVAEIVGRYAPQNSPNESAEAKSDY